MAVSNLNGVLFTGISAIDGITRSTLSAINGQTITAGGGGIAEVGSGSQRAEARASSDDPVPLAYPGSVTAGNLLIASGSTLGTISGITDSVGTSWTVVQTSTYGSFGLSLFIAYGIAGGSGANTISVNLATGTFTSFAIDEFSGVNATPLDANGGTSTGTSTTPSDSITTVADNALIIGVTNADIETTFTPGYTGFGDEEDWNNWATYDAQFRIATAAGSYSMTWTLGASSLWLAQTMSFKPA